MTRILVTGGTGTLGRVLVPRLRESGATVRVMSRGGGGGAAGTEWARADLAAGTGLAEAVDGVDVVVHAASDPRSPRTADVEGTRRLLRAARAAGVRHLVYVSIVGVDRVPMPYYRRKLAVEGDVRASGIPWTTLRATQFHPFLEAVFLRPASRLPWVPLPAGWRFQPVAVEDVAARLARCVDEGPSGGVHDFGGPGVWTLPELAAAWLEARGLHRRLLRVPIPGRLSAAVRRGGLLTPSHAEGRTGWEEWLHGGTATAGASAPPIPASRG